MLYSTGKTSEIELAAISKRLPGNEIIDFREPNDSSVCHQLRHGKCCHRALPSMYLILLKYLFVSFTGYVLRFFRYQIQKEDHCYEAYLLAFNICHYFYSSRAA